MASCSASPNLQAALLECCEKFKEQKHTTLFKRGETAFGMFLILDGKVSLDLGVDGANPFNGAYGPGALVGLPATVTATTYSMTATVTEDSEVGFVSIKALRDMLREKPELCQELLAILSARIAEMNEARKAMLTKESIPECSVGLA